MSATAFIYKWKGAPESRAQIQTCKLMTCNGGGVGWGGGQKMKVEAGVQSKVGKYDKNEKAKKKILKMEERKTER